MRTLKLLFLLLLGFLLQSCSKPANWHANNVTGVMPALKFRLIGPEGTPLDAASLLGKPVLLFFGFTNCPDVCPTTLTQLSVVMQKLGPQANKLQVLFVSVDPGRDTPKVMQRYTRSFGPWLLGLTGPEEALATLRASYGVYAAMESSAEQGTYNVMHSTAIFAFDSSGQARLLITDISDADAVVSDLQHLIDL